MVKRPKLTKKVKKLIHSDVAVSLAYTSILLNVFFFSGILLYANTNRLDRSVYDAGYTNLCVKNFAENQEKLMDESMDKELAVLKFNIQCITGGFEDYHQNAIEAYISNQR